MNIIFIPIIHCTFSLPRHSKRGPLYIRSWRGAAHGNGSCQRKRGEEGVLPVREGGEVPVLPALQDLRPPQALGAGEAAAPLPLNRHHATCSKM